MAACCPISESMRVTSFSIRDIQLPDRDAGSLRFGPFNCRGERQRGERCGSRARCSARHGPPATGVVATRFLRIHP